MDFWGIVPQAFILQIKIGIDFGVYALAELEIRDKKGEESIHLVSEQLLEYNLCIQIYKNVPQCSIPKCTCGIDFCGYCPNRLGIMLMGTYVPISMWFNSKSWIFGVLQYAESSCI